jgi:hypothetical protein
MEAQRPKVFGVGFQKTGTSSLDDAFRILGYRADKGVFINTPDKRSIHIPPPLTNANVLARVLPLAYNHDAFSDNPWPLLFREMDARFPGSKFILTVRDPQRWLASLERHFGATQSDMLQWIYGVPCVRGHAARCLEVYGAHNEAVRRTFARRPGSLLELDIERSPGWDELCRFLALPVPEVPFPHANQAEERERKQASLWRQIKKRLNPLLRGSRDTESSGRAKNALGGWR